MQDLQGKLFLIVGPSGCGKGSVIKELKKRFGGFVYPVSYTTRAPRTGEVSGAVYNFIKKEEFEKMIKNDELLEYAIVHEENYYGTPKKEIMEPLAEGAVVIREVDIQGFHSIREKVSKENLVSIFIMVSDLDDLRGRILGRSEIADEEMENRMESAQKEMAQADQCDYQVENEWKMLKKCVSDVEKIILKEIKEIY